MRYMLVFAVLLPCLIAGCMESSISKSSIDVLKKRNVILERINETDYLLVINDEYGKNAGSFWYVLHETRATALNEEERHILSYPQQIKFSPDKKYASVVSRVEGAIGLDIIDWQLMYKEGKVQVMCGISPFPSYVSVIEWQNDRVIVECGKVLFPDMKKNAPSIEFMLNPGVYSISTETWKVTPVSDNARDPVPDFIKCLKSEWKQERHQAINALWLLNDKRAVPHLEKLLKFENDSDLKAFIIETVNKLKKQ